MRVAASARPRGGGDNGDRVEAAGALVPRRLDLACPASAPYCGPRRRRRVPDHKEREQADGHHGDHGPDDHRHNADRDRDDRGHGDRDDSDDADRHRDDADRNCRTAATAATSSAAATATAPTATAPAGGSARHVAGGQERVDDRPPVDPLERGPALCRQLRPEGGEGRAPEGRLSRFIRLLEPAPRLLGRLQRCLQLAQRRPQQRLECRRQGLPGCVSAPDHSLSAFSK